MRALEIDTVAECFDAEMYPWSQSGDLIMCLDGTSQTMAVIATMLFMWTCGMILGSAVGR